MSPREMQYSFEYGVNKYDSSDSVDSSVVFYWLNEAQERIIKTRYSGVNPKGESFEESQKRTDDLRTLIKESRVYLTSGIDGINKPNSYIAALPADYMLMVGEEVLIQFNDLTNTLAITKRVGVTESSSNTYSNQVNDPYSEHRLHYEIAKPLRLFKDNYVELVTDGNYIINFYYIRYIKLPTNIYLGGPNCELPEHMHSEIVNYAVSLYLENTGDNRYQSNKVELNTIE